MILLIILYCNLYMNAGAALWPNVKFLKMKRNVDIGLYEAIKLYKGERENRQGFSFLSSGYIMNRGSTSIAVWMPRLLKCALFSK